MIRGKSPNISISKFSISEGQDGERLNRKVGGVGLGYSVSVPEY